ncbi:unnamed protein product [Linum tenue]|uniref:TCP domain-containing protein n=1 Tax=Linum tenue TaxID=586396 RepID=A0AAV0RS07_9ROSI|nr:unnamed protein product [Linum tenue]
MIARGSGSGREKSGAEVEAKQEDAAAAGNNTNSSSNANAAAQTASASSSSRWSAFRNPRIVRVCRSLGGKDRHSKVCTVRGLRDRRIRLSVPTAIQLYDLQDRLGVGQPSKVIDWLIDNTKDDIDNLPPLHFPPSFAPHHPPLSYYNHQQLHPAPSLFDFTTTTPNHNYYNSLRQWEENSSTSSMMSLGQTSIGNDDIDGGEDEDDDDHNNNEDGRQAAAAAGGGGGGMFLNPRFYQWDAHQQQPMLGLGNSSSTATHMASSNALLHPSYLALCNDTSATDARHQPTMMSLMPPPPSYTPLEMMDSRTTTTTTTLGDEQQQQQQQQQQQLMNRFNLMSSATSARTSAPHHFPFTTHALNPTPAFFHLPNHQPHRHDQDQHNGGTS